MLETCRKALFAPSLLATVLVASAGPSFAAEKPACAGHAVVKAAVEDPLARIRANYVRLLNTTEPEVVACVRDALADSSNDGDATVQSLRKLPPVGPGLTVRLVSTQAADGTWPDVDYKTVTRSAWPAVAHLSHLDELARSPRTPDVVQAFRRGVRHWLAADPKNPNWWYNEIGAPRALGLAAVQMADVLDGEERAGVVRILRRSRIGMTGQNRMWLAENVLLRALLDGNVADARAARDAICGEIVMARGEEGIQSDWSYHQHGNQPQFGNYGASFVVNAAQLASVFVGTPWQFSEGEYEILENLLDRGFRAVVWKGAMDVGSIGRQLTPNAARDKGVVPLVAASRLALSGRPSSGRVYRDCLADFRGKRPEVSRNGLTWFGKSAMGIYRTDGWMASVKCETKSVKGTERVNEDNLLGAHLADGALFAYVTGNEYRDIFPLWNWRRIPGITSYDVAAVNWRSHNASESATCEGNAVTFVLDRDGLVAKTRWTFSPEGVDVAVTDISSTSTQPVVTTVEQSVAQPNAAWKRVGDRIVAINGAIRYDVPGNAVVQIEERTGNWKRHMGALSNRPVSGRVFEIVVPHGVAPSGASCSWRVRPDGPGI